MSRPEWELNDAGEIRDLVRARQSPSGPVSELMPPSHTSRKSGRENANSLQSGARNGYDCERFREREIMSAYVWQDGRLLGFDAFEWVTWFTAVAGLALLTLAI